MRSDESRVVHNNHNNNCSQVNSSHSNHTKSVDSESLIATGTIISPSGVPMAAAVRMKSPKERVEIEIPETFGTRCHSQDYDECGGIGGDRFHGGYCRTFLAFVFVLISMISNLFVLAIVHERVPRQAPPLPDLGFDLLPRADKALDVSEYIIVFYSTSILLLLFLHRYRQIIFRRIAVMMGILYLFRAICMISTVFPLANDRYYCSPQLFNHSDGEKANVTTGEYISEIFKRALRMFLGFGLSINGRHTYCGDYLYSGHTVTLTI
ncbi:phosphatidylcholine:ceramide cholinephosphotransferase 1-like protein, partial [Dinothrombium tinctorium]